MNWFLTHWGKAAMTAVGFFWMAFWAFALGYLISSAIQVFVTRQRMKQAMGETGPRSVGLGTFFGFISSSCSFAALSTSRSIFQKGAGLVPALAFLLASTNLVVELGIVILVFLSWQFALAEYVGGILLILVMWVVVKLTLSRKLEKQAREHAEQAGDDENGEIPDWRNLMRSLKGWKKTARRYFMEWKMVWKDVTIGFTVAGAIAVFVPASFFQTLFLGSGAEGGAAWWQIALHSLIGPVAAFFTFIGSMGNIPLAGVLFGSGVSFAGIMAFIFSDLVVFPVLRISAGYFGWKMAGYILLVFLICIIVSSLVMHAGFGALGILPEKAAVAAEQVQPAERFKIDYTLFLNVGFAVLSIFLAGMILLTGSSSGKSGNEDSGGHSHDKNGQEHEDGSGSSQHDHDESNTDWMQRVLLILAVGAVLWLLGGLAIYAFA